MSLIILIEDFLLQLYNYIVSVGTTEIECDINGLFENDGMARLVPR